MTQTPPPILSADALTALIYVSAISEHFQSTDIDDILDTARRFNNQNQISGLLVMCEGVFIQLLEGPRVIVTELFERISQDPRHSNVRALYVEPVRQRCFPDWSMAFRLADRGDLRDVEGVLGWPLTQHRLALATTKAAHGSQFSGLI